LDDLRREEDDEDDDDGGTGGILTLFFDGCLESRTGGALTDFDSPNPAGKPAPKLGDDDKLDNDFNDELPLDDDNPFDALDAVEYILDDDDLLGAMDDDEEEVAILLAIFAC
jgi:hypothetical protein